MLKKWREKIITGCEIVTFYNDNHCNTPDNGDVMCNGIPMYFTMQPAIQSSGVLKEQPYKVYSISAKTNVWFIQCKGV